VVSTYASAKENIGEAIVFHDGKNERDETVLSFV
jgi:hypothetical protein